MMQQDAFPLFASHNGLPAVSWPHFLAPTFHPLVRLVYPSAYPHPIFGNFGLDTGIYQYIPIPDTCNLAPWQ
eukprot:4492455-Ditylum_brightwellii.AAC.1